MSKNSEKKKSITSTGSEGQAIPISPPLASVKVGKKSESGNNRIKKELSSGHNGKKITSKQSGKLDCSLCHSDFPHLICILNKDGDIHVHAPFENKYLINEFLNAIIKESKETR